MIVILLIILAITLIYFKVAKRYTHFSSRNIKQRKQTFPLGDQASLIFRKKTFVDVIKNIYNAFPEERYMGMYQFLTPTLIIRDPDLIRQITVKDFDHFVDHRQVVNEEADPLWTRNLVALAGDRWRDMRSTLSPSFTSSKMKGIFTLVSECAEQYCQNFLEKGNKVTSIELKDTFTKYTNDVIGTVAFGIKSDSLKDPTNEFYVMGREATNFSKFSTQIRFFAFTMAPKLCKMFKISLFGGNFTKFFIRVVKETMEARETHGIIRPDMLQLLMDAKKDRSKHDEIIDNGFATVEESNVNAGERKPAKQEITDLDITAQAMIFFFGGFETVSTLLCFMGHELAVNSDVQSKLQSEIDDTIKTCRGKLTYEALTQMKYMDMVVSETMRKWPPALATDRVCVKPYTIPPVKPTETPVHIEKGELLWIPIIGLHSDPKYFPNPDVFDPERFSEENKSKILPYTFLPFGTGPRNCIGSRFALLEVKTVFFHLLRNFDLVVVEKTEVPLKLSKKSVSLVADNGFWIGMKPRIFDNE